MIMVKTQIDEQGNHVQFSVKGHAKYAPYGTDIVCAAVSALAISTANGIASYCGTGIEEALSLDGEMTIFINEPTSASNVLVKSMILGMASISEQYPDNVEIKEGGIRA